jgi:hypothetical protein
MLIADKLVHYASSNFRRLLLSLMEKLGFGTFTNYCAADNSLLH